MKPQSSALGCVTLIVISVGLYVAFGRGGSPTPAGSGGGNPNPGGGDGPAAPVTLIAFGGSGIKNSSSFTTTGPWTIKYSYDCSTFGFDGNFIVTVSDDNGSPVEFPVNELGNSGTSSSSAYSTGVLHLEVNSECSWRITATQP